MSTCDRIGCEGEALFIPLLTIEPEPPATGLAILDTGISVCALHKAEMRVEMLVNDVTWEAMASLFRMEGKVPPDRSSIQIHWEPLPFRSAHH
jgi:hypothetical protein